MHWGDWLVLVTAATAAGWVDAVVGGGGLITLPMLLLAVPGVAPQTALGTNKLTGIAGTTTAMVAFARKVPLDWRVMLPAGGLAAVTAGLGAALVTYIDRDMFIPVVMAALVAVAVFVTARPKVGIHAVQDAVSRHRMLLVVGLAAGLIGFYDGLLGPGTGTFLILIFATLLGTEFIRAAAMAKVINCGSNVGAVAFFAATGNILWVLGAVMALGNIAGALVGSRTALSRGAGFVRVVLLIVVLAMVVRLGWQQFG